MYRFIFSSLAFVVCSNLFGQKIEKIWLDKSDSTRNCYTLIHPDPLAVTGYLFLLPGFGETAESVLAQTDLPKLAARKGWLTVIPTFQDGVLSFGIDSLSQQTLGAMIQDIRSKHNLLNQRFYLGGFSLGGSTAIKFAEDGILKPTAVFAIDPPLDFERFYNTSQREVRLSINTEPNPECVYMIDRIEKEMNGTPKTARSNFYKISPYSYSDTTQTAIKKLGQLPLRIYTEPDIHWWLKERKIDFTSMNATESSAMINELNRLGHTNATLITSQNKGFRKPNRQRHPHAWSIVDNIELIEWLLDQK